VAGFPAPSPSSFHRSGFRMNSDELRQLCWEAVQRTGTLALVAAQLKRANGWTWSDRAAEARVSQMLSPSDPHQLTALAALVIAGVTGEQRIGALFMRAQIAHEDAMRETGEPPAQVIDLPERPIHFVRRDRKAQGVA